MFSPTAAEQVPGKIQQFTACRHSSGGTRKKDASEIRACAEAFQAAAVEWLMMAADILICSSLFKVIASLPSFSSIRYNFCCWSLFLV
jgi:hypothetical protein